MESSKKRLFWEFIRYCFVGGFAFVLETLTHLALWKYALGSETDLNTFIATAAGFTVGLAANYALSVAWVFTLESQKKKVRTARAFLIFSAVGLLGFALKEALMAAGAFITSHPLASFGDFPVPYYGTHIVSAGIVLIWNYAGRKIFVFREKGE